MTLANREEATLVFVAHHDDREVVLVSDADRRCSVVLVDGQIAARMPPAVEGDQLSSGTASERLDLAWLEGAIRGLLDGAGALREAMAGDGPESDVPDDGRWVVEPRSASPSNQARQLDDWAQVIRAANRPNGHLAGLLCRRCGEPMILRLRKPASDGLLCPLCARLQHVSAALVVGLAVSEIRQALDAAADGLARDTRSALDNGFEELERVERGLSDLGSGE